jgi:hypothetical protein
MNVGDDRGYVHHPDLIPWIILCSPMPSSSPFPQPHTHSRTPAAREPTSTITPHSDRTSRATYSSLTLSPPVPIPRWFCLALYTPPFLIIRRHFPWKRRKRQVEVLLVYHRLDDEGNEDEENDILDQTERQGPKK